MMNFDDIMAEMKKKYIAGLPPLLDQLQSFSDETDHETLLNFFHKLKGSGASYGVPQITDYGKKYEDAAHSGNLNLENAVSDLTKILNELKP